MNELRFELSRVVDPDGLRALSCPCCGARFALAAPITRDDVLAKYAYDKRTGVFWRKAYDKRIAIKQAAGRYVYLRIRARSYAAHTVAWFLATGEWLPRLDHKNQKRSDNRIANLRPATRSLNAYNVQRRSDNTSGHRGVSWDKATNKWHASIHVNLKNKSLGRFARKEDAIAARRSAETTYIKGFGVRAK